MAEPPAGGNLTVETEYFYLGGFKGPFGGFNMRTKQDAYLVYPTGAEGPFPLVAFAHGCCKTTVNDTKNDYDAIMRNLASQGVVVASFSSCIFQCGNEAFSGDQLHLVSALRANPQLHPILPRVDFDRVGLMGHSMGGGATITSAGSGATGIRAAAAIHPSKGPAADVQVPMFYMCGSSDPLVGCSGVKDMYNKAPEAALRQSVFADLTGAGHLEIQTPMPGGRWDFYIGQFMLCHLNADATACGNIYGDGPAAMCTAGLMVECLHNMNASQSPTALV